MFMFGCLRSIDSEPPVLRLSGGSLSLDPDTMKESVASNLPSAFETKTETSRSEDRSARARKRFESFSNNSARGIIPCCWNSGRPCAKKACLPVQSSYANCWDWRNEKGVKSSAEVVFRPSITLNYAEARRRSSDSPDRAKHGNHETKPRSVHRSRSVSPST